MKKPEAVSAAEAAFEAKRAELEAAKEVVSLLQREFGDAMMSLRTARIEADYALPQCRMVEISRYSDGEKNSSPVVIVRRTPTGMLVVRHVGQAAGHEWKFKWASYSGKFRQAEKGPSFGSSHRELRDVPADYLPQKAAT